MAFEGLADKISNAFKKLKSKGKLSENDVKGAMREVRLALLEADVNYKVAKDFTNKVTERAIGQDVMESLTPAQMVIKIVDEELTALMGGENERLQFNSKPPTVIMMCGLQGSGKTTHSAKLAKMLKAQNRRPMLVACDIYRPAAIDQLKVVGAKAEVPVFEMGTENPVKIARAAVRHAKDYGNDVVILDTAGRLHIDEVLMNELKEVKAEVNPDEILLVIDSMTGQDAVNVAKSFNDLLEITGVILTKLDGDTRGGAALSVKAVTGKPIKFAGTGEKLDDIEVFHPDRMASRILGMGDVLTLIENAQSKLDEKKAEEMAQKMLNNKLDFNDLNEQFNQIKKMGPLKGILSKLPGIGNQLDDVDIDDRQIDWLQALIYSMTPEERAKPSIINPSRKRRIAAGSGRSVEEVNKLLKQLEQMQKMIKQMKGGKGSKKRRKNKMLPGLGGMPMGGNGMPF
ncbi:signal recognition particle protein [Lachnoclostridium sp. MSJ-17]|uniref:signal recognition particle protein n=1 Tax=Lachnoclostridium sp. MSJ-17 TaxID=2841516 RepID=UPI001C0F9AB7|nr:signal recognition particle protein [Lachnoclostridium sp. MSJ-17]MBU5462188.1 signal recognition particle protein [Lachnoclostridium sp. MSJ-17]